MTFNIRTKNDNSMNQLDVETSPVKIKKDLIIIEPISSNE